MHVNLLLKTPENIIIIVPFCEFVTWDNEKGHRCGYNYESLTLVKHNKAKEN